MTDKNKFASVEDILVQRHHERGYILEDEVVDCCVDHDLDLAEIDVVCDRLLKRNIIFKDTASNIIETKEDTVYDRSKLDYDEVLSQIEREYPSCENLIEQIRSTLPPQHKEWQSLIGEAKNDNKYARERLLMMYLRTIIKRAYDFSKKYCCDFEDAFQNAVIGFFSAIDNYDVSSPDNFSQYFQWWIRKSMWRECVIRGTIMRYPVHYNDIILPIIGEVYNSFYSPNEVLRLEQQIIDEYDKKGDYAGIYNALYQMFKDCYLDEYSHLAKGEINYNHLLPWIEIFDDFEPIDDCEELVIRHETDMVLREVLETLTERERKVIIERYGLDDGAGKTLEEVGQIFGVTRERIRQVEAKALRKLRHPTRSARLK